MTRPPGFGPAWLALTVVFAAHVADEALHDFLAVYNPAVRTLRAAVPLLPLPTLTFAVWLSGLLVAIVALGAATPAAWRGARWLRPIAWGYAIIMGANGVGHLVGSLVLGGVMPGAYTAPLLLIGSLWLGKALAG